MARLHTHIGGAAIVLVMTGTGMGCALVGYDFDGYQPGSGGAGGEWSGNSTASTTAAGGTTGSSTGMDGSSGENCVNGTDDDNDGQTDCADSDCPGFACTPPAPPGWAGPITFWQGPGAPPACGPGATLFNQAGAGAINAPPASCQCACSAPQGATCTGMDVFFYLDDSCTPPTMGAITATNGVCMGVLQSTLSVSGTTPVVMAMGTCQPSVTPMIPPAAFSESAILCGGAPSGGGCAGTDTCAPIAAAPFGPHHCIYQMGDVACSDPAYTVKSLIYSMIDDSRGCDPCSCGIPNIQCTGSTIVYSDPQCMMSVNNVTGPGCYGFGSIASMLYTSTYNGSCAPSPGTATGSAQPGGPITVCCPPP